MNKNSSYLADITESQIWDTSNANHFLFLEKKITNYFIIAWYSCQKVLNNGFIYEAFSDIKVSFLHWLNALFQNDSEPSKIGRRLKLQSRLLELIDNWHSRWRVPILPYFYTSTCRLTEFVLCQKKFASYLNLSRLKHIIIILRFKSQHLRPYYCTVAFRWPFLIFYYYIKVLYLKVFGSS